MRIAVLVFSIFWAGVVLADDDPCTGFAWDMARELNLLRGTPTALAAVPQQTADARDTPLDRRIDLKLAPNGEVKLLTKPQHEPAADSYSGLLRLKVPRISTYRISTDQRLWVEVIGPEGRVKSSKFTMAPGCTQIHKSVAFPLQPDTEYWIQLSGSAAPGPVLLITLDH
jgi:hypothetical protein